jgi:hypothetical protein
MLNSMEEKIKHLRCFFPLQESQVDAFLNAVVELVDTKDPCVIRPILLLADDRCPLGGVMAQMLSCLEDFPLEVYVAELLAVLPEFYAQSPFWCEQEILKILNDDSVDIVLTKALRDLDPKTIDVLHTIFSLIHTTESSMILDRIRRISAMLWISSIPM